MGDFINADIIGARNPDVAMVGNVIQRLFLSVNDFPAAAALGFVLVAGTMFLVGLYTLVVGDRGVDPVTMRSRLGRSLLPGFTGLSLAFLFAPIVVMIVFSFNDPRGHQNITWQGFTLNNYLTIWSRPDITDPMVTSLADAIVSTVVATTFGTMIALALTRYEFRRPQRPEPADLHPDERAGDHPGRLAAYALGQRWGRARTS